MSVERILQGLQGYYNEELLSPLDFVNSLKVTTPNSPGESVGLSGAGC